MLEREKTPLLGMTMDELRMAVKEIGMPAFIGSQLADWIYRHGVESIEEMTNISKKNLDKLQERFFLGKMPNAEAVRSVDGTVKYLFPTLDGQRVESVFIPDSDRGTLCVSSQVGCRMGCRFCMTGRQGFHGNLTATDILNQIYSLPERERLTNVVFMGQGEPLDNLDAVLRATQLLMADYGWAWSPKRITISTVGVRKTLSRFLEESNCHLAISLHSPFPEQRREMIPAEKSYSLTEFLPLLKEKDWSHQRRLSFEYIVFEGMNDTQAHAKEMVRLLAPLECRVNLIHFHQIPDTPFKGTSEKKMVWLRDYLTHHGITTTIRASRGEDIYAACGMLNTAENKKKQNTVLV
ncbi:MAG: 23S rRNA (adenine(2503)-C(2))-methyltransferase RlmN [Bacteroidaceae bacterium]|nr:23S rRNA (adenine(2503)-C(2))-methyltransferase RlmN [Bacteroidaceae bacterium]